VRGFSARTSTFTSTLVRPVLNTYPSMMATSPISMGAMKSTWSIEAVTTCRFAKRMPAMAPQMSIQCNTAPPSARPRLFVSFGSSISVISVCEEASVAVSSMPVVGGPAT
jgi:hypothetical protein